MERSVEFIEPDGDLVKLNEMQKEEIAELIQVVPKKKETGKKMLVIDDSDQIRWFLRHVLLVSTTCWRLTMAWKE